MRIPCPIKITLSVILGLGCFALAHAATLDDYRARLSHALVTIQQLQMRNAQGAARDADWSAAAIAQIKTELPARESVFLPGQTIAVDNTWLHEEINEYAKIRSETERNDQLARIGERLLALIQRLDELRQPTSLEDRDASKARLAEILRRPEYNQAPAEGSALQKLWDAFVRWLLKLFPHPKPLQPGRAAFLSRIAQMLVIAISISAIAFLVWKFGPRYFRNRGKKKKKPEPRIVLGERLEPDQTASDLLAQAEALARAGDLRAAIRKAYIALLCELGDRKILSLAQHKTNRDYLTAVRNRPSLFGTMKNLTNSFELHWYGFVPPAESDWNSFRSGYDRALALRVER